jgi:hypothetical protein
LGYGFFDEALFEADAEVAGAKLDEVFGFEGREPTESLFEQGLFCGGASLAAEGIVNVGDVGEGQR